MCIHVYPKPFKLEPFWFKPFLHHFHHWSTQMATMVAERWLVAWQRVSSLLRPWLLWPCSIAQVGFSTRASHICHAPLQLRARHGDVRIGVPPLGAEVALHAGGGVIRLALRAVAPRALGWCLLLARFDGGAVFPREVFRLCIALLLMAVLVVVGEGFAGVP